MECLAGIVSRSCARLAVDCSDGKVYFRHVISDISVLQRTAPAVRYTTTRSSLPQVWLAGLARLEAAAVEGTCGLASNAGESGHSRGLSCTLRRLAASDSGARHSEP